MRTRLTVVSANPAVDRIITVPCLVLGQLHRETPVLMSAGGKGSNVARVIRRLGMAVTLVGLAGGRNGGWLTRQLRREGIRVLTAQGEGETRVNINIIEPGDTPRETELLGESPRAGEEGLTSLAALFSEALPGSAAAVLSGSLPPDAPPSLYATLILKAREAGVPVILDTSGEPLIRAVSAAPLLIKPNLRELFQLTGSRPETLPERIKACREVLRREGAGVVVLSMGEEGALAVGADYAVGVRSRPGTGPVIRNTIGSGDALVAGIAACLAEAGGRADREVMERALRRGVACALSNASHLEIGWVTRAETEALEPALELETWEL